MSTPRPGILSGDQYLALPRDTETWLIRPLIPASGSAILYGDAKTGKALNIDTAILTPIGWRTIADIQPNDFVFGSDGKPHKVLAISPTMHNRPCFRITFSDGNTIDTDASHEWTVFENCGRNRVRRTLTTAEILTRGLYGENVSKLGYKKARWKVQLPKALTYPTIEPPVLDPYCLGTWLGDGTTIHPNITSADQEVLDAWRANGWELVHRGRYTYHIKSPKGKGVLMGILRALNVRGNKHIPKEYLYGSYETRLALLQGLMDTDGSCEQGNRKYLTGTPTFWNTNRVLAEQVYQLAVSLGARVKWHEKAATLYGKNCGTCYCISIRAEFNSFRLPRKAKNVTFDKQKFWAILSVKPIPSVPVKCLMVDSPDHLYLAGKNCLPTHNSYLAIQLALALSGAEHEWLGFPVSKPGPVVYIQLDTPGSLWSYRLSELEKSGHPIKVLHLADRETLDFYPFDILQPTHVAYLRSIIEPIHPTAVIIDTIRESHSGDEDKSTTMRNVIANLVGATHPAALILISHARKPNQDMDRDLMADQRGSSYVVGRMDAIMRLTKRSLYYAGRSIEEGSIKLQRQENGLWLVEPDDSGPALQAVLADSTLTTMRSKARALAPTIKKSEEAAMSMIRRATALKLNHLGGAV